MTSHIESGAWLNDADSWFNWRMLAVGAFVPSTERNLAKHQQKCAFFMCPTAFCRPEVSPWAAFICIHQFMSFQSVRWTPPSQTGPCANDANAGPERRQDIRLIAATVLYSTQPQQRAWNPVKSFCLIGMTSFSQRWMPTVMAAVILSERASPFAFYNIENTRAPKNGWD